MRRRNATVRHDIETRSGTHRVAQRVRLDEVIIDGILHVEDMGGGVWCIIIGDHDLNISVSRRGVTIVERSAKVRE